MRIEGTAMTLSERAQLGERCASRAARLASRPDNVCNSGEALRRAFMADALELAGYDPRIYGIINDRCLCSDCHPDLEVFTDAN